MSLQEIENPFRKTELGAMLLVARINKKQVWYDDHHYMYLSLSSKPEAQDKRG